MQKETLEEEWELPRKHIRKRGLLRILKKPYELPRHSELFMSTDNYLLNSVLGATPSIKLFSLLEHQEIKFPSHALWYFPYAD